MKSAQLAQTLAIESQIRMPGSAGRLLKQIRDIESVAPLFKRAGLVKGVERPAIMDLSVSGITTKSSVIKALGGFIFGSAAVRTDMRIDQNQVSTCGSDSVSELDDIDFEAQRKRLDLVEMRHAYALVERMLKNESPSQLILLDTPLFISREMIPLKRNIKHWAEYEKTRKTIGNFWDDYRGMLFPWNPNGPVLASLLAERFSAVVSIARQDLRSDEGRKHLLQSDGFDFEKAAPLQNLDEKLSGIGDTRFINGILTGFTRTIAFRMTANRSRMEPAGAVDHGVVGFHYKGGQSSQIKMVQLAGDEPEWSGALLDSVAWKLMVLDMQNRSNALPLPQLLGQQQLKLLNDFVKYYRRGITDALKRNDIEETWISGLDGE
ncbi:hypothetical protein HRM2_49040 [Desulforapulum autotrophicum HRM2]|uniref:NurA domain-containing protein n=1 Tax=Desulforapulum autotrophicum (strain ATCC 43914 / DSM 3382 / VKM B-1955 / HRM2) TaxID=177437 RepID=C0QIK8_DESAH|nr:hypothetical protein [Desulforapulum autotrophicum]ACN17952.1 hypothetical protein HRM2_49040 [Desulforapulum autotrophicum HRM2]